MKIPTLPSQRRAGFKVTAGSLPLPLHPAFHHWMQIPPSRGKGARWALGHWKNPQEDHQVVWMVVGGSWRRRVFSVTPCSGDCLSLCRCNQVTRLHPPGGYFGNWNPRKRSAPIFGILFSFTGIFDSFSTRFMNRNWVDLSFVVATAIVENGAGFIEGEMLEESPALNGTLPPALVK